MIRVHFYFGVVELNEFSLFVVVVFFIVEILLFPKMNEHLVILNLIPYYFSQ